MLKKGSTVAITTGSRGMVDIKIPLIANDKEMAMYKNLTRIKSQDLLLRLVIFIILIIFGS